MYNGEMDHTHGFDGVLDAVLHDPEHVDIVTDYGRDEIPYLQPTFRAWYDDVKEKLLEDYHSGRYTVLERTNMEGGISMEYKGSTMGKVL